MDERIPQQRAMMLQDLNRGQGVRLIISAKQIGWATMQERSADGKIQSVELGFNSRQRRIYFTYSIVS